MPEVTSNMIKSEILNLELEEDFYDIIGIDESAENDLEDVELYLQDGEIDLEKLKSGKEGNDIKLFNVCTDI